MDWSKIIMAVFAGIMIIYLFPRAKDAIKNSPKGSTSDWMGFVIPIVVIALFIVILVKMV